MSTVNVIRYNYIHDHGLANYWHSPGLQIYQSGNNDISYNLMQRFVLSYIHSGFLNCNKFIKLPLYYNNYLKHRKLNIDNQTFKNLLAKRYTAAFEILFKLYYDKLIHIAKNYLIYQEDAEEVIQNVFLKLWENKRKLKTITNINNYIYTITKNACLDVIKHQKVKLDYINSDLHKKANIHFQFINDEAASLLIANELDQKIKKSIELLPQKSKEVFIMSRVNGLKHNEIAEELNISKKTVDNHISKAIKHMKLHLRDYLYLFL